MIVAPNNPNSVIIQTVQTGCCKAEFDSTYPIHLNGIIRQDEFQQSIANINESISNRKPFYICMFLVTILVITGMILLIIGPIAASKLNTYGFPPLVGVGIGIFFCGILILIIGSRIIQTRHLVRLRQAIATESMKYTARSSTPCSWRLDVRRIVLGRYRHRRATVILRIVIDIGHSTNHANNNFNAVFYQANSPSNVPPPPYDSVVNPGFCSQCGVPRPNFGAKFCASCGKMYNV